MQDLSTRSANILFFVLPVVFLLFLGGVSRIPPNTSPTIQTLQQELGLNCPRSCQKQDVFRNLTWLAVEELMLGLQLWDPVRKLNQSAYALLDNSVQILHCLN